MSILSRIAAKKRGRAAPLLFLALALAALGSADEFASPVYWFASLGALWLGAVLLEPPERSAGLTPLLAAIAFFSLWLAGTNAWANPSYSAAGWYHAAFLLGGFLAGRRAGAEGAPMLFAVALAFALGLAGWAIWQRLGTGVPRAVAIFETPATLSSTINLLLLPTFVLVAGGKRTLVLIASLAVLGAAALVAAASRGGWIALGAGAIVALLLARRGSVAVDRRSTAIGAIAVAFGALIAWAATLKGTGSVAASTEVVAPGDPVARLELYRLALGQFLNAASPLFGTGYLSFYYVIDASRPLVQSLQGGTTYFVHNDYLQALLELGVPGFAGLTVVAALPAFLAWRGVRGPAREPRQQLAAIAVTAALSSMAIHALADFPFHIPACLLIFGAGAGLLDSYLSRAGAPSPSQPRRRIAIAALGALAFWAVLTPAIAQVAAAHASSQWTAGRGESAAYWFEVARRIEPRDWRFHWYAGRFWYVQALENNNSAAAGLADAAFSAGVAANGREVRNLLGRIAIHARLRKLLAKPADARTLLAWCDRAMELAPLDPNVNAEVRFAKASAR